ADRRGGNEVRGEAALHVARASPPDPTFGDLRRPRFVVPQIGTFDGDDVDVAVEMQRVSAARAPEPPCDGAAPLVGEVRIARVGVSESRVRVRDDPLDVEPGGEQSLLDELLRRALGAERAGAPDELARQLDEVVSLTGDRLADCGIEPR